MRINVPFGRFGFTSSKLIFAGVTALLLSGCSSSIDRFATDYSNPSDADPVYTASVPKYVKKPSTYKYAQPKALAYREDTIVQSPIIKAPLNKSAAPTYDYVQDYKKPYKQPTLQQPEIAYDEQQVAPVLKKPVYKAQSYKAPTYAQPDYGSEDIVAENEVVPVYKKPSTKTGATVRVAEGMTLYSIAKANGITVDQLAEANGIAQPYTVSTGRLLRIPGKFAAQTPEPRFAAKKKVVSLAEDEQMQSEASPKLKVGSKYSVANGDTLYSLGRKFGVSPFALAELNGLPSDKALSIGQTLRIPAGGNAVVAQSKPKKLMLQDENTADDSSQVVADENALTPVVIPKTQTSVSDVPAIPSAEATNLAMRWPVRGKVISNFGKKPSGLKNEGINISVPEGTSIRAAESGVVAYAGNELKGYGNLILIRHAGGFVTAYAHAKALNVKRGDTVKRGDVIAVAGQTGAVQSPQLHFEVRKGATALDPTKYLSSSTASN